MFLIAMSWRKQRWPSDWFLCSGLDCFDSRRRPLWPLRAAAADIGLDGSGNAGSPFHSSQSFFIYGGIADATSRL